VIEEAPGKSLRICEQDNLLKRKGEGKVSSYSEFHSRGETSGLSAVKMDGCPNLFTSARAERRQKLPTEKKTFAKGAVTARIYRQVSLQRILSPDRLNSRVGKRRGVERAVWSRDFSLRKGNGEVEQRTDRGNNKKSYRLHEARKDRPRPQEARDGPHCHMLEADRSSH